MLLLIIRLIGGIKWIIIWPGISWLKPCWSHIIVMDFDNPKYIKDLLQIRNFSFDKNKRNYGIIKKLILFNVLKDDDVKSLDDYFLFNYEKSCKPLFLQVSNRL